MTCIVGLKANNKVYLAGERGASDEESILEISKPKIHRFGPYIVGFAGTMEGQRLEYSFDPPEPSDDDDLDTFMHTVFLTYLRDFYEDWWVDTSRDAEFAMLIAIKDKLYGHNASDMSMAQYTIDYQAVGSGSSFALGFLYGVKDFNNPVKIIEDAVNAAIKFSPTCSGKVDILST